MGQQQLLLIILVTIIVGIATIVAINVFNTSAKSANRDAVRQDMLTIAAAAQGWYIKPDMMGGGNYSFAGMTFYDFNFTAEAIDDSDSLKAYNMNGLYVINTTMGNSFTISAYPAGNDNFSLADTFNQSSVDPMTAKVFRNNIKWD